jgi:hypothetical protein
MHQARRIQLKWTGSQNTQICRGWTESAHTQHLAQSLTLERYKSVTIFSIAAQQRKFELSQDFGKQALP